MTAMKKLTAIVLSLVCLFTCVTALADRAYLMPSDSRKLTEAELWEWDRDP